MTQYPGIDIERSTTCGCRATISGILPLSPADDAGFEPGCIITAVDGQPLRDLIDWRWLTSDDEIELSYIDLEGEEGVVDLWREEGQDWGIEFDGVVFDNVKLCRNSCVFCFMRQLPGGLRDSLTLRDDDYRLSFLSGTFVTLTNLTDEDEQRIVEQRLSPLRMSLHASNPAVRAEMIGKHAQCGIDSLERLLQKGIQFHTQIVLCPGLNDEDVLKETLAWAYARPGILNIGIVPLGYTKHQARFLESFNSPRASLDVIEAIKPFQEKALAERGNPWVYAADEFYLNAFGSHVFDELPPSSWYGDFSMFEDGIGIVRSFVDDWDRALRFGIITDFEKTMSQHNTRVVLIAGMAQRPFLTFLVERDGLEDVLEPLYVENDFFGGNVDVTGLLVGCDIVSAIKVRLLSKPNENQKLLFAYPSVIVNDDGLLLDGMTAADMENAVESNVHMVSCNASEYLSELIGLVKQPIA